MTGASMLKKAALTSLSGAGLAVAAVLLTPTGAAYADQTIDLYAETGSMTLPGSPDPVPVWGYNRDGAAVTAPGGPTLEATAGEKLTITLHNDLAEPTALLVQGQEMVPDRAGADAATTKSYTFTVDHAGTYLYEAGLLPNAQHQVAMGLYGVLVVRPAAAGQAYADASTAFDVESVQLLSELDPSLNAMTDPARFDMRNFAPTYFLVNGKVYPETDPITVHYPATVPDPAEQHVLLRYVNAGISYHSMGVLGAHQRVIALDGSQLGSRSREVVAETFGPGQTADTLVTVPVAEHASTLAVYDANLSLRNSKAAGFGGMLSTLEVAGSGAASADTIGPVTSNMVLSDVDPVTGRTLTGTVDDSATGDSGADGVECFLDTIGNPCTDTGEADGEIVTGTVTGTDAEFRGLGIPAGNHVLYVRGQDGAGNWGPLTSLLVNGGDASGPVTKAATLTPAVTNGTKDVAVSATGDDSTTGGSTIQAAEYSIGGEAAAAGSGTEMTVNTPDVVASLDAVIPATDVAALDEKDNSIWIRSQDSEGAWGDAFEVKLTVDKTGPVADGVVLDPSPNDGTQAVNASTPAVRVRVAQLTDPIHPDPGGVRSAVVKAEMFVDTVGADGSGIVLEPDDGVFDTASESGYADIPLATVRQMTNGPHVVYVHAKDAAGNWGDTATGELVVAIPSGAGAPAGPGAPPAPAGPGAPPAPAGPGAPPAPAGPGAPPAPAGPGAGITPFAGIQALFATTGSATLPQLGTGTGATLYQLTGGAVSGALDPAGFGIPSTAKVDGVSVGGPDTVYLSFSNAKLRLAGVGVVRDEDVVVHDQDGWRMFFDGSANGLRGRAADVDAIDVRSGRLFFSTVGNVDLPGVRGTADNADIYRWNGARFARVWDASRHGLARSTNVDGVAWSGRRHVMLSFGNARTAVRGLGVVPDEDIVTYHKGGAWQVYLDGSALGLGGSNAADVSDFDVP